MISFKILDEYLDKIEAEIGNPPTFADIEVIDKHLNLSLFGLNQFVNDLANKKRIQTTDELVLYLKYTLHHIIIMRCERNVLLYYFDRKIKKEKNQYMEYSDEMDIPDKHYQYLTALERWGRDGKIPRITEKTFLKYHLEKFYHYMDKSFFESSIQDKIIYMLYCTVGYYINDDNDFLNSENLDEYQESNLETVKRFRHRVLAEN